jgi:Ca-activated chloride channel family protein
MWADFHCLRPAWLLALFPLLLLLAMLRRPRPAAGTWRTVCAAHLLPHLLLPMRASAATLWLLGLGWLLAVLALAGPAWSRHEQPLWQSLDARVIVLDLSRSMLVSDLPPSRLSRARFKLTELLRRFQEGQTGLVVFAGEAFTVAPLTWDSATLAALLPVLEPDLLPAPGTRTERGLYRAAELLRQAGCRRGEVLLVADDLSGPPAFAAASELRDQGFRVSVLAVGTVAGAPVPLSDGGFARDAAGDLIIARLPLAALQQLAAAGGGRFALLSADERDLRQLWPATDPTTAEAGEPTAAAWREQGPWLVLALLPLAALAFRRGWLGLLLLALISTGPPPAQALDWASLWQPRSSPEVVTPAQAESSDPLQRGIAAYRRGDYATAAAAFAEADGATAHYNRGNALVHLQRLPEALAAYDAALALAPNLVDARHNRALVAAALQSSTPSTPFTPFTPSTSSPLATASTPSISATVSTASTPAPDTQADTAPEHPADNPPDPRRAVASQSNGSDAEQQQTLEQWLRQVPDDPGGLLRRKFRHLYQRAGSAHDPATPDW